MKNCKKLYLFLYFWGNSPMGVLFPCLSKTVFSRFQFPLYMNFNSTNRYCSADRSGEGGGGLFKALADYPTSNASFFMCSLR